MRKVSVFDWSRFGGLACALLLSILGKVLAFDPVIVGIFAVGCGVGCYFSIYLEP